VWKKKREKERKEKFVVVEPLVVNPPCFCESLFGRGDRSGIVIGL